MTQILQLTQSIDETIPNKPNDEILRESYIDVIERTLKENNVIFIEGESGVGKTTLLRQFAIKKRSNVISHFINQADKYTYKPNFISENLVAQVYYYTYGKMINEEDLYEISENFNSTKHYKQFRKKIRKTESLYFIFDGIGDINKKDRDLVKYIIDDLPWGSVKVIFSGDMEELHYLIPPKQKSKSLLLPHFDLWQTKEYFKGITDDNNHLREIHRICKKGLPERLWQVKRICKDIGIDDFMSDDIDEKTNLFDVEWRQQKISEQQNLSLSVIAFHDSTCNIEQIAKILECNATDIVSIKDLPFIQTSKEGDNLLFVSDSYKRFAQTKLSKHKNDVTHKLIEYYEKNPINKESFLNLPPLYYRAKKMAKLTEFLSVENFVKHIENEQSLSSILRNLGYGIDSSKQLSKFNGTYFRLALHKSSILEIERCEILKSEMEAMTMLGKYQEALALARSPLLKEDKLELLSILAKYRKEKELSDDEFLKNEIKLLYDQINFDVIKDKAIKLSSLLLYSCPDLAIDLAEKLSGKSSGKNSIDMLFAILSLQAMEINKKTKSDATDVDLIQAKIRDEDLKKLVSAFKFFADEYKADGIKSIAKKLKNVSQKLFILRGWISSNQKDEEIADIIDYTLNIIISNSSEEAPSASVLADIASPLPKITDIGKLKILINLFDSQKEIITTPTRDYVRLQLILSEAVLTFEPNIAKDRLFELYANVDDISDLSIKIDCLCLFWNTLISIDKNDNIRREIMADNIEKDISNNIDSMLSQTAYHYKLIEYSTKLLSKNRLDFVLNFIKKLNTEERRDAGFRTVALSYVNGLKVDDIDFSKAIEVVNEIKKSEVREDTFVEIVDRLLEEEKDILPYIESLIKCGYIRYCKEILNSDSKSYAITKMIVILHYDYKNRKTLITKLLSILEKTWSSIDAQWKKVEIGYLIARDLVVVSEEEAQKYVVRSSELRRNIGLFSSSMTKKYVMCIRLCIQSFYGLIKNSGSNETTIEKIHELIRQIPSTGYKIMLWSDIALKMRAYEKHDDFRFVVKKYLRPLFEDFKKCDDKNRKYEVITNISPTLYLNSKTLFNQIISDIPKDYHDEAYSNIMDFLITKVPTNDPAEEREKGYNIEYKDCIELVDLLEKLQSDYIIHEFVRLIVKAINNNNNRITREQKSFIKQKIDDVIDRKLPSLDGIQHKGYWIVAHAQNMGLSNYDKNKWSIMYDEAQKISNISDRALLAAMLSDTENRQNRKGRKDINELKNAIDYIKKIPSNYDKLVRFCVIGEYCYEMGGKEYFMKVGKEIGESIIKDKNTNIKDIRSLIDMAQQYHPKLADIYIEMLDQDPARKKAKSIMEKIVETDKKIDAVNKDFKSIKDLSSKELIKVSQNKIAELNSGRFTSKEIDDLICVIEKICTLPISECYPIASYFIQNAIIKYENNNRNLKILQSLFDATYENAKFVYTLCLDSLPKIKTHYKNINYDEGAATNEIFSAGERGEVLAWIKTWFRGNLKENIIIVDPYFTKDDLELIQIVQEISPECEITILTSKESGNNSHDNNQAEYRQAWKKISSESPPITEIIIVWINGGEENKKSPFHDRWWLFNNVEKGLRVGTSFNSMGKSKDFEVSEINSDEIARIENDVVSNYIYRRVKKYKEYRLSYNIINLND